MKEKYTWDTAPRWDRQTMETGAYGRLWNTALAQTPPNPFFEATGDLLKLRLPKGALPETRAGLARAPQSGTPSSATGPGPTARPSPPSSA